MATRVATPQPAKTQRIEPQRSAQSVSSQGAALSFTSPIHKLQRAVGNRAMTSLLRSRIIQPKLNVSHPDDQYEREADRVADQVMRMSDPLGGVARPTTALIQRKCRECAEEEQLQRHPSQDADAAVPEVPSKVESYLAASRGGGRPLPLSTRAFFESRIGQQLGHVRVHTDRRAAEASNDIKARAFTAGSDIAFAAGEYRPDTLSGQRLLAHELTHVVQQGRTAKSDATSIRVERNSNGPIIQRACGPGPIAAASSAAPPCIGLSGDISDITPRQLFRFKINCDEFASTTEAKKFADFLKTIRSGDFFKVHGFASVDGDMFFNMDLSCARAKKAAQMIRNAGGEVTDIISFGPTPGVAADRRSVVITRTMIPIESPRVCPDGTKTVDVSIFLLPGATRSASADLGFANRVFADCCVRFNPVKGASLSVPGWANTTLHHIDHCGGLSAEEEEMFQQAKASGSSAKIWIFYVENYDPDTVGSKGISCRSGIMSGTRALFPEGAYIKQRADPSTLAHELGHILIRSADHFGIVDPTDPTNLMMIQDPRGQNVGLDSGQCKLIFAHA